MFRLGVNGGPQSAQIDFLEEFERSASLEFAIESILWIATPRNRTSPILRVRRSAQNRRLATPIPLSEAVVGGRFRRHDRLSRARPARARSAARAADFRRRIREEATGARPGHRRRARRTAARLLHARRQFGLAGHQPEEPARPSVCISPGLFLESNFAVPALKGARAVR